MSVRRGWAGAALSGLALAFVIGCSAEDEGPMDPGVSPFYPGPSGTLKSGGGPDPGAPSAPVPASGMAGQALRGGSSDQDAPDAPIGPGDAERNLRIAILAAQRGDQAKAARILDQVLAVQPLNREALLGRAAIALDLAVKSSDGAAREEHFERAVKLERALRRAYEVPSRKELELTGRLYYQRAHFLAGEKRFEEASAAVRAASDGGVDFLNKLDADADPVMVALRGSSEYQAMLKKLDADQLVAAREHLDGRLHRPLDFAFDFHVKDVDGKPLSLDQYRGKVVLIDIWGTWCQPCRQAIPGLVALYQKYERDGFAVIGLAFEKDAPDEESAARAVKAFLEQTKVPYRCGIGDESLLKQIPDFHAFPTTMVLDRSGKVRIMYTDGSAEALNNLHAAVQILLNEPAEAGPARKEGAVGDKPASTSTLDGAARPKT